MKSRHREVAVALFFGAITWLSAPISAQTVWNDATGNWFTAANWTVGAPPNTAPPDNNTNAQINNGGTAQVNAAGATALTLNLGLGSTDSGSVTIGSGGNLHIVQFFTIGNSGTGNMAISGGGVVNSFYGVIGSQTGAIGTVTIDGAGSSWSVTSDFVCGDIGTGTLTITNGGALTTNTQNDHVGAYGTGTLIVDGVGSTWTHNNDMEIGNVANSTGTVTIRNHGTWTLTGTLQVGASGSGTLNILSGGTVSGTDSTIGNNAGSTGMATVDGAGSMWTNSGSLDVGLDGHGTLNITNGGAVTVNGSFARIAEHATSTGTVTVDGAGSTWRLANELDVARAGTGTLTIQNGSIVNMTGSDRVSIGVLAGSNGTLNILNGGTFTGFDAFIAQEDGSTGLAVVNGAGGASTLQLGGNFFVGGDGTGPHGTGVLRVLNGGIVNSNRLVVLSTGTLEIGANPMITVTNPSGIEYYGGTLKTIADTTLTNNGSLQTGGVILDSNGFTSTLSGTYTGSGGITKIGTGTIILSGGFSPYGGVTHVDGGVFQIDGSTVRLKS